MKFPERSWRLVMAELLWRISMISILLDIHCQSLLFASSYVMFILCSWCLCNSETKIYRHRPIAANNLSVNHIFFGSARLPSNRALCSSLAPLLILSLYSMSAFLRCTTLSKCSLSTSSFEVEVPNL